MSIITHSLRTSLSKIAVAVTVLGMSSAAFAISSIQNVSVNQVNAQQTELNIDFAGQPIEPTAYMLHGPARLVLDFPNVTNSLTNSVNTFNRGGIKEVSALNNHTITRLTIGLDKEAQFTTRVQGNRLVVALATGSSIPNVVNTPQAVNSVTTGGRVADNTMMVKVNPLLNPTQSVARQYNYDGLTAINVNGTATGGGNVVIGLSNESIPLDVQRAGDELVIRLTGATIPKNLLKQINVGNGLVRSVVTNNQGRNGVIRVAMNGDYEYKAYQSGNQLNIGIEKPRKLREPTLEERTYSGAPLSLDFQDMPVRTILNILGSHTNTNIVAADNVTGNITLRLVSVPWDQALDIILKSKGLDKRTNGNVIWVAPAQQLRDEEKAILQNIKDSVELEPLRTEFISLNYAKAEDIRTLIEAGRSQDRNGGGSGTLLSSRGAVSIDGRTNTLIIKDTVDTIKNIRDLVNRLDIPVKQVMIEARIVSASDNFSKELGVKWGVLSNGIANNRNLLVGGNLGTIDSLKNPTYQTATINGRQVTYPQYGISNGSNLSVDLGASNPAGRIAFGLLSMSDMLIDLELSAMQADGRGEVISSPKVLTADKQTAKVMSGTQIPYQEASASGATSTSFIEAALSLEVTPNITPDGRIGMELKIENGSPTPIVNGAIGINKDAITTNVVVDDGQTVVLGGVFKNSTSNDVSKVPFLGDLPYVGNLFKKTMRKNDKQELLIFVTPKLVHDNVNRIN